MSGFGSQPLGSSPYGIGSPAGAPVPGGAVNRNTSTGLQNGSRLIDPATHQYVFDAYGRTVGMPSTRQRVLLAVNTARGSSAQGDLGHLLGTIQEIGPSFVNQVTDALNVALQPLIDEGAIRLLGIQVQQADGRDGSRNIIRWVDLSDGQPDNIKF